MIAEVIVDVASSEVDKVFDYIIPNSIDIKIGQQVLVPFGNRKIFGFVINIKDGSEYDSNKLKEIIKVDNTKISIDEELIQLCNYLTKKYYLKMIDCIRACIPSVVRNNTVKEKIITDVSLNSSDEIVNEFLKTVRKNAVSQIGVINYLKNNAYENITKLNNMFSSQTINKLINQTILITNSRQVKRSSNTVEVGSIGVVTPTDLQQSAINKILNDKGKTVLLHGVTGSGKTEIYLQVIDKVLKEGKTAIMLVPEISLTPQMVTRFRSRFGDFVAVLHSGLSSGEKFDEWNDIKSGKSRVVVGARSAIFSPIKNLGVIIIDEEHDVSYISDSNPRYNTVDVAKFRSEYNNSPLVLGTATPNIETYYKAKQGEYELIELPVRVNNLQMPPVSIVDMVSEFRNGNQSGFSNTLLQGLDKVIDNNNQAILFINRRGFSSFVMCRDCGYVPACDDCDITLSLHKNDNQLKCHYCGKRYKVFTKCPKCSSPSIKLGGVGTERVVEDLQKLYPDVKIFRMDNDTTTTKDSYGKILSEFEKTTPAFLVGTQMISKGHDFPKVSLVGILDADLSLYFGEFRATERTYQLITQVSGRAGRKNSDGSVVLQTYYPKHYVYKFASNYDYISFYEKEINLRQVTKFPPYTKITRILISAQKDIMAQETAFKIFKELQEFKLENKNDFLFLEAMRSPINRIKGKYRYQIVSRFFDKDIIVSKIFELCDKYKNKNVSCFVEINPQTLS